MGKDFETVLVKDTVDALFLEVRYFNNDTGTFDTVDYFTPGSTTPATPTGAVTYLEAEDASEATLIEVRELLKGVGGTARTPGLSRVTIAGNVAAGKYKVQIFNTGSEIGTVLGTNLGPNEQVTFEVRDADTLGVIAYDPTAPGAGTEFVIVTIE